jgi:hypothetical protein
LFRLLVLALTMLVRCLEVLMSRSGVMRSSS